VSDELKQTVGQSDKSGLLCCPCGATPKSLHICDNGQGGKWANCSGDCCAEWQIEFRTQYNKLSTDDCYALAVEAWNEATRAT
jgi:hypothetical protein